ncbi:WRKY transcription factor [Dionaea muscipula]
MLVITYTSEHNHPWPTQRNSLAGSTRSHHASKTSRDKSSALSTQMAPPASITIKEEEEERLEAPHQIVVTTTTTSHHVTNGTPSCSTSPTLIRRHNNIIDIDDDQLMSNQGFYDPYRGGSAGGVADHVDDQDEMDLLFAELGDLLFTGQPRFSDQDKQSRDQLGPFSGLF